MEIGYSYVRDHQLFKDISDENKKLKEENEKMKNH